MTFKRGCAWLAVWLGLLCMTWACGDPEPASQKAATEKPKLVVATDPTLAPMSFVNDGNELAGFEIDLIGEIAGLAGFDYEMVRVDWPGLFGGLITKKYDLVISSVTILEERKQRMAFSTPYLQAGLTLIVRHDREGVATVDDIKKNDLRVGAQVGTTSYFFLESHPGVRKKGYQLFGHAVADLINGELDAVVGESTGTLYFKAQRQDFFRKIKMVGDILTQENYGIVLRKDEPERLRQINEALAQLLKNGAVARLHEKWDLGRAARVPSPEAGH